MIAPILILTLLSAHQHLPSPPSPPSPPALNPGKCPHHVAQKISSNKDESDNEDEDENDKNDGVRNSQEEDSMHNG